MKATLKIFVIHCLVLSMWISPLYAGEKKPQDIIVFDNQKASRKKADMPPARFSHPVHSKLKCKDCHPNVFKDKKGTNLVTMKRNVEGEYCGKCHNGQSSWDMSNCKRCHV